MTINPFESPPADSRQPPAGDKRPGRSKANWAVLYAAAFGAIHFAISLFWWGVLLYCMTIRFTEPMEWPFAARGLPAVVLLPLFAGGWLLAWRRRRGDGMVVLAAILLSLAVFVYDAVNHNCQLCISWKMENSPPPNFYATWWWYDDRWFYGR